MLIRIRSTFLLTIVCAVTQIGAYSQDSTDVTTRVISFPEKFFGYVGTKAEKVQSKINASTERYLNRLLRQELKLKRRLQKIDSVAANDIFGNIGAKYAQLRKVQRIGGDDGYHGHLDSITTLLRLANVEKQIGGSAYSASEIKTILNRYTSVQKDLSIAKRIGEQLKQRQHELKIKLQNHPLAKQFKKYQATAYYYRAQVEEYRNLLCTPDKIEQKALQIAKKLPVFQGFFARYSQLSALFPAPAAGFTNSLPGLQDRQITTQGLMERFGSDRVLAGSPAGSVEQGTGFLNGVKAKLNSAANISPETDTSTSAYNSEKTKSFIKRLEYISSVQNTRANLWFPAKSDFTLSVGYKLNSKSVIGVGVAYALGWGKPLKHIAISHQGFRVSSFLDLKVKGKFWFTGSGELNRQLPFESFRVLNSIPDWKKSLLFGASKRFKAGKNKTARAQVLYDVLYRSQVPETQPFVFRLGYHL